MFINKYELSLLVFQLCTCIILHNSDISLSEQEEKQHLSDLKQNVWYFSAACGWCEGWENEYTTMQAS